MTRLLLVDDHSAFRQPLAFMLNREPDLEVVAQAGSLAEARGLLSGIDLAVVDLGLPDGHGVDLVRDLRVSNPEGVILVLTAESDRPTIARAVEAGASGVLHKSSPIARIIEAIRALAEGQQLFSQTEVIDLLRLAGQNRDRDRVASDAVARLTPRERQVLQALADGLNDKEIGARLSISHETARTHMVNILQKLSVDSRLQALLFALRHGLVQVD